jgi:hypothetical protein
MSHSTIALTANPSVNVQVNNEVLEIHDCAQNLTTHRGYGTEQQGPCNA